jgi:3-oxoadipate enol-lactonase
MKQLAADVAALCEALSIDRCHVAGHSLGGMVALQLALDFPSLVRSLAVINSSAYGHGSSIKSFLIRCFIRLRGMPAFARVNSTLHLPKLEHEPLRRRLVEMMGSCPPDGYLSAQAAVDGFDVRSRLDELACPTLVVHSDHDPFPLEDVRLITDRAKQARMATIEDSRHIVVWDQPERLNSLLLEFLDSRAFAGEKRSRWS